MKLAAAAKKANAEIITRTHAVREQRVAFNPGAYSTPGSGYTMRKGVAGIQVQTATTEASIPNVTRGIARSLWTLGYEVACQIHNNDNYGCWSRTSVRHLDGRLRPPFVSLRWGRGKREFDMPQVQWDVVDGYKWSDPEHIKNINEECDLLLVPAVSNVKPFIDYGVKSQVAVVPLGIDPTIFKPKQPDRELLRNAFWFGDAPRDGDFVFLVAGFLQERKGVKEAIEAFTSAFSPRDNVCLLIKNVCKAWGHTHIPLISRLISERGGSPRIGVIEAEFSEPALATLMSTVDCYLSPHKREGFGLMPLQALACGTPAIVTAFDGPLEYMTEDCGWLVDPAGYDLRVLREITQGFAASDDTVPWAHIDVAATAKAMQEAVETAHEKAHACRERALEFTWDATALKTVGSDIEKQHFPCAQAARRECELDTGEGATWVTHSRDPVQERLAKTYPVPAQLKNTKWDGQIEGTRLRRRFQRRQSVPRRPWIMVPSASARVPGAGEWGGGDDALGARSEQRVIFLTDADGVHGPRLGAVDAGRIQDGTERFRVTLYAARKTCVVCDA
jgi:glycosyltransferase involved in cell wall biosynthesis